MSMQCGIRNLVLGIIMNGSLNSCLRHTKRSRNLYCLTAHGDCLIERQMH